LAAASTSGYWGVSWRIIHVHEKHLVGKKIPNHVEKINGSSLAHLLPLKHYKAATKEKVLPLCSKSWFFPPSLLPYL
jgi:hypothetical protein